MRSTDRQTLYQQRITEFSNRLALKRSAVNRVSTWRLVTAGLILGAVYFSFQHSPVWLLTLILVAVFILLVRWHSNLFDEQEHLENLVAINQQELAALSGNHGAQPGGTEYADPLHPYAHDLDLFGDGSLFQFLNRACTAEGKRMLARRLLSLLPSGETIRAAQEAVREVSSKLEFRQHFQAEGMSVKDTEDDRQQLREWSAQAFILYRGKWFRYLLLVAPVITIVAVALAFILPVAKSVAVLMVLIQLGITGVYLKRIQSFHDYVSRKKRVLEHYARLLKRINAEPVEAALLKSIQTSTRQAEQHVGQLASLLSALDARLNFMTSMFMNGLLLYDLQCVYRLEQWKDQHAPALEGWLDAISEIEVVVSFGTYAYNHTSIYPDISPAFIITGRDLAHPLLSEQERVANTVTIGNPETVLIITGANMAGKSTFLRTLGVNIVLALNGSPVCATEFSCPVIQLCTGMRTTDSLKDHQSYFYAELQRLKRIVDDLRSGRPLFILLDEILKGTNSSDKLAGSIALIRQLICYRCLAVVATHDLALGDLEQTFSGQVINYHFEPTIENDQLDFDYRLKRGIAEKMNATFLMKKMGIIE
jgi:ABC-type multidrug transport system fused ATPase/permease subunit